VSEVEMIQKSIDRCRRNINAKHSRLDSLKLCHRIPDPVYDEILQNMVDLCYWIENIEFWQQQLKTLTEAVYPPPTGE